MSETTALGAAMAAGAAEGVNVWSLRPDDLHHVTSEKYKPQINSDGKKETASHAEKAGIKCLLFICSLPVFSS